MSYMQNVIKRHLYLIYCIAHRNDTPPVELIKNICISNAGTLKFLKPGTF